ncbi:rho guanine nucleotide exchange factor 25 [Musca domestica]|uniref:Rho guanine nucleotide exchange factor 25 n=1 Tax=Musca domestica TaxID=7370 RepID=A0A1I8MGM8_MUSDO|nr:rho guanine nucleotide exchange factor 25 [Musca domestica]
MALREFSIIYKNHTKEEKSKENLKEISPRNDVDEKMELKRQKSQIDLLHTIEELISTEESYIGSLSNIVNGYIQQFREPEPKVPIPKDLKTLAHLIFNNIEDIYQFHKTYFYDALKASQHSPNDLAKQFLRCESQFHMYSKFCSKTNMSQQIVSRYKDYFNTIGSVLGRKNSIDSDLMHPTQRLIHYKMIMGRLVNDIHVMGCEGQVVDKAYEMIERIVKETDSFKAVDGICNYPGDITCQGKLIHSDFLNCKHDKKSLLYYVFIFKHIMLFTERRGKDIYNYKMQIPMNKLKLEKGNPFILTTAEPNSRLNIRCRGQTPEDHRIWLEKIQSELSLQAQLIAELENPSDSDFSEF